MTIIKPKQLQKECVRLDDDIRWLLALISDTGMRLSEAVGLLVDDLVVDVQHPLSSYLFNPGRLPFACPYFTHGLRTIHIDS